MASFWRAPNCERASKLRGLLLAERGEHAGERRVDALHHAVERLVGSGERLRLGLRERVLTARQLLFERGARGRRLRRDVVEVFLLALLRLAGLLVRLFDERLLVALADLHRGVAAGFEPVVVDGAVEEVALAVALREVGRLALGRARDGRVARRRAGRAELAVALAVERVDARDLRGLARVERGQRRGVRGRDALLRGERGGRDGGDGRGVRGGHFRARRVGVGRRPGADGRDLRRERRAVLFDGGVDGCLRGLGGGEQARRNRLAGGEDGLHLVGVGGEELVGRRLHGLTLLPRGLRGGTVFVGLVLVRREADGRAAQRGDVRVRVRETCDGFARARDGLFLADAGAGVFAPASSGLAAGRGVSALAAAFAALAAFADLFGRALDRLGRDGFAQFTFERDGGHVSGRSDLLAGLRPERVGRELERRRVERGRSLERGVRGLGRAGLRQGWRGRLDGGRARDGRSLVGLALRLGDHLDRAAVFAADAAALFGARAQLGRRGRGVGLRAALAFARLFVAAPLTRGVGRVVPGFGSVAARRRGRRRGLARRAHGLFGSLRRVLRPGRAAPRAAQRDGRGSRVAAGRITRHALRVGGGERAAR